MKKSFILALYGVALYFVLRNYYRQGNTGIPDPRVIGAPTYLYGILSLVTDFTGGFTIPLAAGMTFALAIRNTGTQSPSSNSVSAATAGSPQRQSVKKAG